MSVPHVSKPVEFGDPKSGDFCVEYPNGLVDLSRSNHLDDQKRSDIDTTEEPGARPGSSVTTPTLRSGQLDVPVTGDKTVRVDTKKTGFVIIDMQNFFLHQDIRDHPKGLAFVDPLMKVVPFFRDKNIKRFFGSAGALVMTSSVLFLHRSHQDSTRIMDIEDLGQSFAESLVEC